MDEETKDRVWWGDVNIPIDPKGFQRNKCRAIDFFNMQPRIFVIDGYAGYDTDFRKRCRVIATRPYHALFMKQMLIREDEAHLNEAFGEHGPDFSIMNAGEFWSDPSTEDINSQTTINVNFKDHEVVILGSQYAGEMKKGIFGVMHYYMPQVGALSMHASANEGPDGSTTILFGLSGTGKTTLSCDPHRSLIGDDEHVWCDNGIFNIEGGCYAKCIGLSEEKEPEIYNAIRFGAVVENIQYFKDDPRTIDYDNVSITENTRTCYPLDHIENSKIPSIGGHPKNIIFLTCDANGVLPPVSKLTFDQAMYHFISGYTAKVAGTEMGITDPIATFSACFGEAFLPLHPYTYAKMLAEKVEKYKSNVWLVNTGWSGGKYGVGERMSLKITRKLLDDIHSGYLEKQEYVTIPGFNLAIPKTCSGIDSKILNPINTWEDKEDFKAQSLKLASKFVENFDKYKDGTPEHVIMNGGPDLSKF